ncbi:hypothetical protein I5E68_13690 [Novosphingobium sp. YJ-S2-02]|uniref:Uncharacterized protein n=1 Tax=Novosphingobium aureum TaxID=2792964 RepID=A0A931MM35_9SPHN|nr:hypothetical protein [Novosphingobium aureum]MBH0113995.1 hypothetical protein [Novosphingobium aureum]
MIAPAMLVCAAQAHGQTSLKGWSLPEPEASASTPAITGPVDPLDPSTRPRTGSQPADPKLPAPVKALPSAAPSSAPATGTEKAVAPRPVTVQPDAPTSRATPRASASPSAPAPRVTPSTEARPIEAATTARDETPEAAPAQPPAKEAAAPEPRSAAPATFARAPAATASPPEPKNEWPWWPAIPAGVVAGLGLAAYVMRKRRAAVSVPEANREAHGNTSSEREPPSSRARATPATLPAAPSRPASASETGDVPAPPRASGELAFDPLSLRLSLVYATLRFRLQITAETEIPPARLLADMISAHGSLGKEAQLAPAVETLTEIGSISPLARGQSQIVTGELQIPLAAIRPVRDGNGAFMVPLVRLAFLDEEPSASQPAPLPTPGLPRLELGCVFAIGLPGEGRAIAPIRIDSGPREVGGLVAQEIEAGRRRSLSRDAFLAA